MPGEAFTKPATNGDIQDFNLDEWINGARLPEKSVTVYGRADLDADITELELRLRAAQVDGDSKDERLAGGPSPTKLAAQIEAKRAEMEASALTFRFRALLAADAVDPEDGARRKMTDDEIGYANLSIQCLHPKVAPDQWAKIRAKIGEGQFQKLLNAAAAASYDRDVSVPFSLAASALLSNGGS